MTNERKKRIGDKRKNIDENRYSKKSRETTGIIVEGKEREEQQPICFPR